MCVCWGPMIGVRWEGTEMRGVNTADWRLGTLSKLGKGVGLFSLGYGISLKD